MKTLKKLLIISFFLTLFDHFFQNINADIIDNTIGYTVRRTIRMLKEEFSFSYNINTNDEALIIKKSNDIIYKLLKSVSNIDIEQCNFDNIDTIIKQTLLWEKNRPAERNPLDETERITNHLRTKTCDDVVNTIVSNVCQVTYQELISLQKQKNLEQQQAQKKIDEAKKQLSATLAEPISKLDSNESLNKQSDIVISIDKVKEETHLLVSSIQETILAPIMDLHDLKLDPNFLKTIKNGTEIVMGKKLLQNFNPESQDSINNTLLNLQSLNNHLYDKFTAYEQVTLTYYKANSEVQKEKLRSAEKETKSIEMIIFAGINNIVYILKEYLSTSIYNAIHKAILNTKPHIDKNRKFTQQDIVDTINKIENISNLINLIKTFNKKNINYWTNIAKEYYEKAHDINIKSNDPEKNIKLLLLAEVNKIVIDPSIQKTSVSKDEKTDKKPPVISKTENLKETPRKTSDEPKKTFQTSDTISKDKNIETKTIAVKSQSDQPQSYTTSKDLDKQKNIPNIIVSGGSSNKTSKKVKLPRKASKKSSLSKKPKTTKKKSKKRRNKPKK